MIPTSRLVAMENVFFAERRLDWPARCQEIAAAGFAAVYAVLHPLSPAEVERAGALGNTANRAGLRLAAVYLNIDLAQPFDSAAAAWVQRCVATVSLVPRMEISFKATSGVWTPVVAHDAASRWLAVLVPIADARGVHVAIYPHSFYPIETLEQVDRLVAEFAHRVGVVFPLSHLYSVMPLDRLRAELRVRAPRLTSLNVCGCRRLGQIPCRSLTLPLDEGDFDPVSLVAEAEDAGYAGDIVVQGNGWPGDVRAALRRARQLLSAAGKASA